MCKICNDNFPLSRQTLHYHLKSCHTVSQVLEVGWEAWNTSFFGAQCISVALKWFDARLAESLPREQFEE